MSEERARILRMVNDGQISAEEGIHLLDALTAPESPTAPEPPAAPSKQGRAKWFKVRVTDLETGRAKVNVNLPLSLVRAGLKVGSHFAPEIAEMDWDEILAAVQEGASGPLVDVEDVEDGERVEISVA